MSLTFEYNETGSGSSPFADDNNNNTSLGLFGCGDPGGGGGGRQELRWGMMGLSILIVATASGNLLVCLAVSWERRLQNMTNYFLMSLAIADLLVSLLVMPLAMIVEMFGCFPLDRSLCVIWATMDVLLCTASIWHMCTMSMDRYFTIRYPIRYGRNKTKKMMTLKITFVWIISFSVSAPLAIAGFVDYSNVYNDGRCVPSIKNFVLYGSLFAFYVPLIIMVTTYTLTIRILKQNRVLMSGLQGKYHFPLPIAGERLRRGHRSNGLSRTGGSTRRSCPDLSPPRSDFTMTSVGMTSPKGGSSAESTMTSPSGGGGGERRGAFNARNKQRSMRAQLLKANLADDDNYVNCNFDQKMFLKPAEPSKDVRRPSLVVRLKEALTPSSSSSSSSPKRKHHSKSTTTTSRADRRRSHPNPPRYRIDPDDQWNPSLMPFFRISRYYSDSNLAFLQAEYDSQSVLDTSCFTPDGQRLNGGTTGTTGTTGRERLLFRQDQTKNGGEVLVPNSYIAPIRDNGHQQTTGLRLPGSTAGGGGGGGTAFDDSSYPDFEMTLTCYEDGETLQMEAPSSCLTAQTSCMTTQTSCMTTLASRMTTQTTTTDASGEKSPFPVDGAPSAASVAGRHLENSPPFGRSWTLSTADGRGLEEKQRNGGGPPPETTDGDYVQQEPDNNSYVSKQQQQQQHSNGSAKKGAKSNSTTCKEDEAEELDEVRGLLASTPTRRKGPPPRPSSMTGSPWSRTSPSTINTSPSSSDSRSILRARFNLGRSIRKATPVSACARKIGLLSKNRTNNERKASKVLGIIFAVFVLSWTPFFTMNIVSVLCDSCMETITDSMMASMVWLGYLSSLANPIIYTMFSTSFRTVFYRILTCQYSNQTVRCGQARSGGGGHTGLPSNDDSFLCWSRSGARNSSCCLKDFETKKIGGV